jgi:hypothetical protein
MLSIQAVMGLVKSGGNITAMLSALGVKAKIQDIDANPSALSEALEPIILRALKDGSTFQLIEAGEAENGPKLVALAIIPKKG